MIAANGSGSRLFTGLLLSEEAVELVTRITGELSAVVEGVRWVPAGNLHVTLKFIGASDAGDVPCLLDAMSRAAKHLPFGLEVGGLGAFPSLGSARVLWVGARDLEGGAVKVFNVIDKGAERCGVSREKRAYTPHVTIGRCRRRPVRIPTEVAGGFAGSVRLEVSEIVLFSSELKSTGAEYSVVEKVGL